MQQRYTYTQFNSYTKYFDRYYYSIQQTNNIVNLLQTKLIIKTFLNSTKIKIYTTAYVLT